MSEPRKVQSPSRAASNVENVMARRAAKLASALVHRINVMVEFLAPDGGPPVFTRKVSREDALAFWARHRTDELGQALLSRMDPRQIMALDQQLAQAAAMGRGLRGQHVQSAEAGDIASASMGQGQL